MSCHVMSCHVVRGGGEEKEEELGVPNKNKNPTLRMWEKNSKKIEGLGQRQGFLIIWGGVYLGD